MPLHAYKVQIRIYSKFHYLINPTRDPINISQTVHFFTSYYLQCVKSLRIYAAHDTQILYFTAKIQCKVYNSMPLHTYKVQKHTAITSKTYHFDIYPNLQEIL